MKKIGICGYYAKGLIDHGGQPVKTKHVTKVLENEYGTNDVNYIDTTNWKKRKIRLFLDCIALNKNSENIIILPASKGLKVFVPLFFLSNIIFRKKLHYILIGGWLIEVITKKNLLLFMLKRFNTVFVETHILKDKLNALGLQNVQYLPNFKDLKMANPLVSKYTNKSKLRFCTFSRIVKGKGIDEAIQGLKYLNEMKDEITYTLDIYGDVHKEYLEEFSALINNNSEFVEYMGAVKPSESVKIIKDYFMLLFPTKFYTEGVPGTIIDCFYAGVPVISSKWESFSDLIHDGENGIGYKFNDFNDFMKKLKWAVSNVEAVNAMKYKCQLKALEFSYENATKLMTKHF